MRQLPTLTSFVMFLALCASITYWLLQWMAPASRPLATPIQAEYPLPDMSAAANLFGGSIRKFDPQGIQLRGIIFAENKNGSVALLSLEGKPIREFRSGDEIFSNIVLETIELSSVTLSNQGKKERISLSSLTSTTPKDKPKNNIN